MSIHQWNNVIVPTHTILNCLKNNLIKIQKDNPTCLPDFHSAKVLLLASDYSGESSKFPYFIYSFLITSLEAWIKWEPKRLKVRKKLLPNWRRMSFKTLNDIHRRQALLPLLEAADSLEGLSFSLAVNKKCKSFFVEETPIDLRNPDFEPYRKWKKKVLEKSFIIIHFLGFLLAGLSRPGQDVLWFTDEDDIAANDQRVFELTNLFAWISSQYLNFSLGHFRCGTSRCDDGTRQIEDLLSIPDLIAGALAEQFSVKASDPSSFSEVFWLHRGDFSEKTRKITSWFSRSNWPLKRLVYVIEPEGDGHGQKVSLFHFYDPL